MKKIVNLIWSVMAAVTFLIYLSVGAFFVWVFCSPDPVVVYESPKLVYHTEEDFVRAVRYHGITPYETVKYNVETGKGWFYRDRQWISLFGYLERRKG